ncbi:hypothetical protein [Paenibacillus taichungensis]|uniref:hypothetical protein n=1 Tax=Paenibacillus taichungensis TaxID=484184 RepID=UPI0035DEE82E
MMKPSLWQVMESYGLSTANMAHRNDPPHTDAVTWWNNVGRNYGAKSKEVRDWKLDSNNYVLDHYSLNRSDGAKLGQKYLPPKKVIGGKEIGT